MKQILFIIFCLLVITGCHTPSPKCEKEIYLVAPDFRGHLIVYFDQPDGQEIQYEDSARLYRVPRSGFLKSQFQKNGGCMTGNRILFFYEDSLGQRTPLDYFLNLDQDSIPQDRDYVLFTLLSNKDSKPDFVIHLIGTVYEFNDLTGSIPTLNPVGILESLP